MSVKLDLDAWINATKQTANKKAIDERARVVLTERFFVSISTTQSFKCSDQVP